MIEEEKRAQALHAGLKALEVFHPIQTDRTVARLVQYTMLGYNWISEGIIGNSVIPQQVVEQPIKPPELKSVDSFYKKASSSGG